MKKIITYFKDIRNIYLYLVIFILLIVSIIMTTLFITKKKVVTKTVKLISNEEKKVELKTVKVDIKGNVVNPGVYELEENSRVIDVINLAGGLLGESNTELINLSQKVTDEMTIIIYTNKEITEYREKNKDKKIKSIEVEKCPDVINDACINKENNKDNSTTKSSNTTDEDNPDNSNQLISINTATIEELQSLTGVGESKAKSIILYREENGNFNTIDDIKNVSGIGDALFEKIKDYITI